MSTPVTVREYAWLGVDPGTHSLDYGKVSESAFGYLCRLSEDFSRTGARLAQLNGRRQLRLDNYVGVVRTPCGTTIEVLPKIHGASDSISASRELLRKLIGAALSLPVREVGEASLQSFEAPLSEWVIRQFLGHLELLVKRGVRFDYLTVEEELPYLRGRLNLDAQLRQPPGRAHRFQVRHDDYLADCPENRLLRKALDRCRRSTSDPENWRLAQELTFRLAEVTASTDQAADFLSWRDGRLMGHYRAVKPWCKLVLTREQPLAVFGATEGLSLLFPMQRLFEGYVAAWFRRRVAAGTTVRTPAASESLCTHDGNPMFQLEPDIYVTRESERWILDTKWKALESTDRANKYHLSQTDLYQMFAYGHCYLGGAGAMALIFPRHEGFREPLAPFDFGGGLVLHVLPFDLERDELIGAERLGLPFNTKEAHKLLADSGARLSGPPGLPAGGDVI